MKRLIKLGTNHYIYLDSYIPPRESPIAKIMMATMCVFIATITVGAMAGVDVIQLFSNQTQHETR